MRSQSILSGLALLAAVVACSGGPEAVTILLPSELSDRRDSGTAPTLIDVRTAEEYETGHIPGAVNIPYDEVAERISEVDAPHGVALYCMHGPRANRGEEALLAAGHGSVFHLEGGLHAWRQAGYPVSGGD